MSLLGYTAIHLPTKQQLLNAHPNTVFSDIPCIAYYDILKELYDLTIVVTMRNYPSWLESAVNNFKPTSVAYYLELRHAVYGSYLPRIGDLSATYDSHYHKVCKIADIVIPLEQADKWTPLCDLFGKPVPDQEYPHL